MTDSNLKVSEWGVVKKAKAAARQELSFYREMMGTKQGHEMTDALKQAAQQALEALESLRDWPGAHNECTDAVIALRAALAAAAPQDEHRLSELPLNIEHFDRHQMREYARQEVYKAEAAWQARAALAAPQAGPMGEAAATPPADEFGYLNAWLNTAREMGEGECPLAERMATRLLLIAEDDDLPVAAPQPAAPEPCEKCYQDGFLAGQQYGRGEAPVAVQAVPLEDISRVLADAMNGAAENGANSVSMPDYMVRLAFWLDGIKQPGSEE